MSVNSMMTYNGGTVWTRNSDYFLAQNGYNTTATSAATSGAPGSPGAGGTGGQGVTLISNRHVLMANHVSALWGTGGTSANFPITVYFVNNSNNIFTYTIDSIAKVSTIGPSSGAGYTDISIGYLNTTVDASLSFYKVVPSNFFDYIQDGQLLTLPSDTKQFFAPYFPVFFMDGGDDTDPPNQIPNPYQKRTWCGNLQYITTVNPMTGVINFLNLSWPRSGPRSNNCQAVRGGDSGNIIFLTLNTEIVIVGTWFSSGAGNTPGSNLGIISNVSKYINDFTVNGTPYSGINTVMNTLAGTSPGTYSVTQSNLSSFYVY